MDLTWMSVRAGWRRSRASSVAIVLLIGVTGGFVVASASAARVVDSAFQSLLRDIDAPDLIVISRCDVRPISGCDGPPEGEAEALERLTTLDAVEQERPVEVVRPYLLTTDGEVVLATADNETGCLDGDRSLALIPLVDGGPNDQTVPFRLMGRLPASNEMLITRATGRRVGLSTGDEVVLAGWCTGNGETVELDSPIRMTVSGVSIGPLDIEPPGSGLSVEPTYVDRSVFDALLTAGAESSGGSIVWLDENSAEAATRSIEGYDVMFDIEERAATIDTALDNDARALWAMAIAGFAIGLLVIAPIIYRVITGNARDVTSLAAVGARLGQRGVHVAAHLVAVCLSGLVLAAILTPLIQPRIPLGLGSAVLSDRTSDSAPLATAVGMLVLAPTLAAIIAISTWRAVRPGRSQSRVGAMTDRRTRRPVHLRPARQTGVMAAAGRPAGRRLVNPWPGIVSLALALVVSIAGLTYVAGLRHLEQTPRLTGWNWDMAVEVEGDSASRAITMAEIASLPEVDILTQGTLYPPLFLSIPDTDFQVWPWSFATGPEAITAPVVEGRAPQGPDEIAVDRVFSDFTGHEVGDFVVLSRPTLVEQIAEEMGHAGIDLEPPETAPVIASFEITGIAVLPTDRTNRFPQASFTLDGLADFAAPGDDEITAARELLRADLPDEVREEVDRALSDLSLDNRVAYIRAADDPETTVAVINGIEAVSDVIAPEPNEVLTLVNGINVADNDRVLAALTVMGLLAAGALGIYLLITSMWARRSEMGVLRALGMSGTNVRSSFVAQATTTVLMVVAAAVPVGLIAGQWAWTQYAHDLEVVEEPVAPTLALSVGTAAAILIGAFVATIVASLVVRRSAAEQLRAE